MQYIIENLATLLLVLAAAAALVWFAYKGNKSVVMRMLYALVTEAEKNLGSGTGSLKLATVIEIIYPKLPGVIKLFISADTLEHWVEDALAAAKVEWEKNAQIAAYIAPEGNEKNAGEAGAE